MGYVTLQCLKMMTVEDHYISNYYKETKTCLLHQPLVQTCIVVTDMNPAK
jgi:hypothetical protein